MEREGGGGESLRVIETRTWEKGRESGKGEEDEGQIYDSGRRRKQSTVDASAA